MATFFTMGINRISDFNNMTVWLITSLLVLIYPIQEFIRIGKLRKITPLIINEHCFIYYKFKEPLKKEDIREIEIKHGHVKSFACIKLEKQEYIKWFQLLKKYTKNKYDTTYLINLDELKGEVSSNFDNIKASLNV